MSNKKNCNTSIRFRNLKQRRNLAYLYALLLETLVAFLATSCVVTFCASRSHAQDPTEPIVIYSSKQKLNDNVQDESNDVMSVEASRVDELTEELRNETTDAAETELDDIEKPLFLLNEDEDDENDASNEENVDNNALKKEIDVLIDMRHAHDFSDYPLSIDDRSYHRIYSFNKAFAYLQSQGIRVEKYESKEPIDDSILNKSKVVFLNLPSADKEPFLLSELVAFMNFVRSGGSLFFIVEHTNCYFHQSRLIPLFHELDIVPQFYGVCDTAQNLGSGFGWLYVNKFSDSPVVHNLREIAFQTGGGVDPRYAVAWSSDKSWQDKANIPVYGEADLAYFGNFSRDADEPVGACACILAKTLERGKIVAVGDQNIFSAFFLQYLDNYRLWINSFAWLLDKPELADPEKYFQTAVKENTIVCWEELQPEAQRFGNPDPGGYYNLYSNLCRRYNAFCVAHDDSELGLESNVLVLLQGVALSRAGVDYAYRQLERGKTLVVIDPPTDVFSSDSSSIVEIINRLKKNGIVADPERATNSKYVATTVLTNGGKIIAQHGRESFANPIVPAPEARLTLQHQENLNALFKSIDNALKE